jgi:hypothetical protein
MYVAQLQWLGQRFQQPDAATEAHRAHKVSQQESGVVGRRDVLGGIRDQDGVSHVALHDVEQRRPEVGPV